MNGDGPKSGDEDEPVEVPLDGVLDLHTFAPRDVVSVVEEYLLACRQQNVLEVRLIHGKGIGFQRARVHDLLGKLSYVRQYRTPDETRGGWGATLVDLEPLLGP